MQQTERMNPYNTRAMFAGCHNHGMLELDDLLLQRGYCLDAIEYMLGGACDHQYDMIIKRD